MPKKKLGKPKPVSIQVLLSLEEKQALQAWAESEGKTVSELVRAKIEPLIKSGQKLIKEVDRAD